jgi:hypothetical protein
LSSIHPCAQGEEDEVRTFWKEGYFCGIQRDFEGLQIYIPGQRQIEVSRDVTFDEEVAFRKSRESHMEIDSEEQEAPKDGGTDPSSQVVHPSDYQEESVEPAEPVDLPRDVVVIRKRPAWLHDTLQDAKGHATPSGTFRERKRP